MRGNVMPAKVIMACGYLVCQICYFICHFFALAFLI
jgi:hypothetical protein